MTLSLPYINNGEILTSLHVYPKASSLYTPPEPLGGEKFIKTDEKSEGLAGAHFKVMRVKTDRDGKELRDASGNFVFEAVLQNEKELILIAGNDGRFEVNSLAYGTYWLVETVTPPNYQPLTEALPFAISASSYEDNVVIKIENRKKDTPPPTPENPRKPLIPYTGDEQILLLFSLGLGMIILGVWLVKDAEMERKK